VIATASTRNLGRAQQLGPDQVVDHTTTRFEEVIDPVDLVFGREIAALYFVVEPNREQLLEIATLAESGELRPMVDEVFDLADARSAFARTRHDDGPQERQPASRHS
jgi:NADPH:quinone reductase-like Zn-dependent oxidoreductase